MVDRLDVEVQQCMELTSTNRSCGLTTYLSHARAVKGPGVGESNNEFESRREKVEAVSNHAPHRKQRLWLFHRNEHPLCAMT